MLSIIKGLKNEFSASGMCGRAVHVWVGSVSSKSNPIEANNACCNLHGNAISATRGEFPLMNVPGHGSSSGQHQRGGGGSPHCAAALLLKDLYLRVLLRLLLLLASDVLPSTFLAGLLMRLRRIACKDM